MCIIIPEINKTYLPVLDIGIVKHCKTKEKSPMFCFFSSSLLREYISSLLSCCVHRNICHVISVSLWQGLSVSKGSLCLEEKNKVTRTFLRAKKERATNAKEKRCRIPYENISEQFTFVFVMPPRGRYEM